MRIIGLEEHFATAEVTKAWLSLDPQWQDLSLQGAVRGELARRLLELDGERLAAMDEVGLDVQVLSLTSPGVQNLAPAEALALQSAANDLLAETVRAHPDRFQGLATLATPDPAGAARELERAVTKLGLNGGMLFGRTRERNLDHPDFWPSFEAAEALRAPLYLHPQSPRPTVREALYSGLGAEMDIAFATYGIGWHYEAGVQLVRLMLSGVFDRFPDLQIITGHWGEVVLFYIERIESIAQLSGGLQGTAPPAKGTRPISDIIRRNVSVTPSGIWSQRYLRWAIEAIGVERILFSTDYPFVPTAPGGARSFLEAADLSQADREKIASGNWNRLCADIRR